jgi:hypothetical protein
MKALSIELIKCKRSGVATIMTIAGLFGALYIFAFFFVRNEMLMALPIPPMDILLTQAYGLIAVINMLSIIVAACLIYRTEYAQRAIQKMYALPIKAVGIYGCKACILVVSLIAVFVLQYSMLGIVGNMYLPEYAFRFLTFLKYSIYTFLTTLPVVLSMLIIASQSANMWIVLGVGVIGFFSGMAMSLSDSIWLLINPFALILAPALSDSAILDNDVLIIAIVKIIIYFLVGIKLTDIVRHE